MGFSQKIYKKQAGLLDVVGTSVMEYMTAFVF